MANTKEIQRRIKSVKNTKKITKAMEMVAAAKMKKATDAVLRTRTYANLSWATVINISKSVASGKTLHPLLSKRKNIKRVGIILMTSNRGLCGGFNSLLINKVIESIKKHQYKDDKEIIKTDFILMGKKGDSVYTKHGFNVTARFSKLDIVSEVKEVMPVARLVIDDYLAEKYDKVMVAYTDFETASKQVPRIKQLLPIDLQAEDDHLGIVGKASKIGVSKGYIKTKEDKYLTDEDKKSIYVFKYEPSPWEVLDEMIPRLIEVQLYQALLESNASEHSARMSAMHQATDAASDIVDELVLYYNKARQASITNEIAEISAGANALGN